jgi:hypothetical protein
LWRLKRAFAQDTSRWEKRKPTGTTNVVRGNSMHYPHPKPKAQVFLFGIPYAGDEVPQ